MRLEYRPFLVVRLTVKLAFISGSSRQGKACLAQWDSNWVTARYFVAPAGSV